MDILNKESELVTFIAEMKFKGCPKRQENGYKKNHPKFSILMNLKRVGLNGSIQKMKPK